MSKINKLGKSTFVIAILSFLLVAVLAFGGTYAYFSAKDNLIADKLQLGTLTIESVRGESTLWGATSTIPAVPNEKVFDKEKVTITMTGTTINYFMRIKFDVNVGIATGAAEHATKTEAVDSEKACGDYEANNKIINFAFDDSIVNKTGSDVAGKWTLITDESGESYYYLNYNKVTEGATYTIGYDHETAQEVLLNATVYDWVGANGCRHYMGASVTITLTVEAIQADWLPDSVNSTAKLAEQWKSIVETNNKAA